MLRYVSLLVGIVFIAVPSPSQSVKKIPCFNIVRPTVVAFFAAVAWKDHEDGETNESLSDFQFYSGTVKQALAKAGIEFHVVYADAFRVRAGAKVKTFSIAKEGVGYYLVAPGKKPLVEHGVMTDTDLLQVADQYFGLPVPAK